MADVLVSGLDLVNKINSERWFYSPQDKNSLVTDAKLEDGTLSYVWAGFSECHDSSYSFSRALDHGDGRITVFANVSFQHLDSSGVSRGIEERPVLVLYDLRHLTKKSDKK